MIAVFLLIGLALVIVVALRLTKRLSAPLNSLAEGARKIAAGDLSARVSRRLIAQRDGSSAPSFVSRMTVPDCLRSLPSKHSIRSRVAHHRAPRVMADLGWACPSFAPSPRDMADVSRIRHPHAEPPLLRSHFLLKTVNPMLRPTRRFKPNVFPAGRTDFADVQPLPTPLNRTATH